MSGFTGKVTRPPADLSVVNEAGIVVIDGSAGISSATVYCGCDEAEVEVEAMREFLRLWDAEQAGDAANPEPLPEGYRWEGDTLRFPDRTGISLQGGDIIVSRARVPAWAVRRVLGEQDIGDLSIEAFSARCEADRLREELAEVMALAAGVSAHGEPGEPDDYGQLLAEIRPRPIRDAADYESQVAALDRLMGLPATEAVSSMIELLSTTIAAYESSLAGHEPGEVERLRAELAEARKTNKAQFEALSRARSEAADLREKLAEFGGRWP